MTPQVASRRTQSSGYAMTVAALLREFKHHNNAEEPCSPLLQHKVMSKPSLESDLLALGSLKHTEYPVARNVDKTIRTECHTLAINFLDINISFKLLLCISYI